MCLKIGLVGWTGFVVIFGGLFLATDGLVLPPGHQKAVPFDDDLEGDIDPDEVPIWNEFSSFDRGKLRDVAAALESQLSPTTKTMASQQTIGSSDVDLLRSVVVSKAASCDRIFCPAGRVCKVVDRKARCVCRESCPEKKNQVCGTDGVIYTSHCELHRSACALHRHIGVDRTGNACAKDVYDGDVAENVFTTVVTVGNSIELKCSTNKTKWLSWKRNGSPLAHLTADEIKVYDDGSLYIGNLALHLMGNYTCHDKITGDQLQKHELIIQDPPHVYVYPQHQSCGLGASVTLRCHAMGVPEPAIVWEHKSRRLDDLSTLSDGGLERHTLLRNNSVLEVQSVQESGSYECYARNSAGSESHLARITVDTSGIRGSVSAEDKQSESFAVFHDRGYTVYEVGQCHMKRQVSGDFALSSVLTELDSSTLDTLCPRGNESCSWGDAVVVGNSFVYVSQPAQRRVVVIDLRERFNPVEVIVVDGHPISLEYVGHLDQVWVVCLVEMVEGAEKMAVMLRDAGKTQRHHLVHIQSDDGDAMRLMDSLFLPTETSLDGGLFYGYSTHRSQMALQKLDLVSMKYVKSVDLGDHDCHPAAAVIVPIGGFVVISCENSDVSKSSSDFLLVLDYVTDAVLFKFDVGGSVYVSPDSRHVVVLTRDGKTISAFKISNEGRLEHSFDEHLEMEILRLAFVPSESGFEYSVYGVSFSQPTVLLLDIHSGKASLIEGVNPSSRPVWWAPLKRNHVISCAPVLANHVVVTGKASLTTFEIGTRRAQCTWDDVRNGRIVVPVPLSS